MNTIKRILTIILAITLIATTVAFLATVVSADLSVPNTVVTLSNGWGSGGDGNPSYISSKIAKLTATAANVNIQMYCDAKNMLTLYNDAVAQDKMIAFDVYGDFTSGGHSGQAYIKVNNGVGWVCADSQFLFKSGTVKTCILETDKFFPAGSDSTKLKTWWCQILGYTYGANAGTFYMSAPYIYGGVSSTTVAPGSTTPTVSGPTVVTTTGVAPTIPSGTSTAKYTRGWDAGGTISTLISGGALCAATNTTTFQRQIHSYFNVSGMSALIAQAQSVNGKIALDLGGTFETGSTANCYFKMNWIGTANDYTGDYANECRSGQVHTIIFDLSEFDKTPSAIEIVWQNYTYGSGLKNPQLTISLPYVYGGTTQVTTQPTTQVTTQPTTITQTNTNPTAVIYGDVNKDLSVTSKDSLLLKQFLADWEVTINNAAADVNADGYVSSKDSLLLKQFLADWEVTLGPKS